MPPLNPHAPSFKPPLSPPEFSIEQDPFFSLQDIEASSPNLTWVSDLLEASEEDDTEFAPPIPPRSPTPLLSNAPRASTNFRSTFAPIGTQSLPPPDLPQLVAKQHQPISVNDNSTKRLIVVLSHASLETYKTSGHGPPTALANMRAGRVGAVGRDEKYTLLNSDEHIGVMRKMGRDISEARPDITHQVRGHLLDHGSLTIRKGPIPTTEPPACPSIRYQQRTTPTSDIQPQTTNR